jgi:uncharacterized protein YifE (UPF0438 family)
MAILVIRHGKNEQKMKKKEEKTWKKYMLTLSVMN